MKLWLLSPIENLQDSPWEPWYDKVFGFVIRAETEMEARRIADENYGDENFEGSKPWLHSEFSTCIELTPDGESELILRDKRMA